MTGPSRGGAGSTREVPPFHAITDDRVLADPAFPARARAVLEAVGPAVALHVRGPRTAGRQVYELAALLLPAARASGGLLLVNDRVDVAAATGADGVQLGRRSLPVEEARGLLAGGTRVGASVHDPESVADAAGADFLLAGTIFATASHPGRPGAGPARVSRVRERVDLPVLGIGGVTPDRVASVVEAGAAGVAALGGVWNAPDPAAAARAYVEALRAAGIEVAAGGKTT